MIWLLAAATAHPLGARFATQTTSLVVFADHVEVDYAAEVPLEFVGTARPGGSDPVAAMATEIASGLLLEVDGRVVSMVLREPMTPPGPTSEHTLGFALALSGPLPADAHEIRVSTANLQDAQNFFAGDVRLAPGLRARACSLLQVRARRVVRDDTLRWTRDEGARTLSVALAPTAPAWFQALANPDDPVRVSKVLVDSLFDPVPEWIELGLALGALGGARLLARPRQ